MSAQVRRAQRLVGISRSWWGVREPCLHAGEHAALWRSSVRARPPPAFARISTQQSPAATKIAKAQEHCLRIATADCVRPFAACGSGRALSSSSSPPAAEAAGAGGAAYLFSGVKSSAFADSYQEALKICITDTMAQLELKGCTDSHKVVSVLWVSDNEQLPMQSDGSNGGVIYEERGPTFLESIHQLLPPLLSRNTVAAVAAPFKTASDARRAENPPATPATPDTSAETPPTWPPTPPVFSNKPVCLCVRVCACARQLRLCFQTSRRSVDSCSPSPLHSPNLFIKKDRQTAEVTRWILFFR